MVEELTSTTTSIGGDGRREDDDDWGLGLLRLEVARGGMGEWRRILVGF